MYRTIVSALLTLFTAAALASGFGSDNERLTTAVPPAAVEAPLFASLDSNGNGTVDRNEVGSHPPLTDAWQRLDRNDDGRLVQSEFGAFEEVAASSAP